MNPLRAVFLVIAACFFTLTAIAQPPDETRHYRARFTGPFALVNPGIGRAPYSAEQIMETGGRILSELLFRDSQGRTRGERSLVDFPTEDPRLRSVQIVDPISGYQYFIDNINKVAHRIKVQPVAPDTTAIATTPSVAELSQLSFHADTLNVRILLPEATQTVNESLGERWIDDVLARGIRTTVRSTIDSKIVRRTEAWISDERKVLVLSKREDPRYHDAQTRMLDYQSIEPDPALFKPPPDYAIVDEVGPFTIDIVVPSHER